MKHPTRYGLSPRIHRTDEAPELRDLAGQDNRLKLVKLNILDVDYSPFVNQLKDVLGTQKLSLVILNAGVMEREASLADVTRANIDQSMALNMAVETLSIEYHCCFFVALHPGHVRTSMGGPNGNQSPEESVTQMVATISKLTKKDTGRFLSFDGQDIPF